MRRISVHQPFMDMQIHFSVRKLPFHLRTKRCSMMQSQTLLCINGTSSFIVFLWQVKLSTENCSMSLAFFSLSFVMLFRRFERRRKILAKHGHDISPTQIKSSLEQFPCLIWRELGWGHLHFAPKFHPFGYEVTSIQVHWVVTSVSLTPD